MASGLLVLLLLAVGTVMADITRTNPAMGACLCVSGTGVNVRSSACGSVIGSVNQGQCFAYSGSKASCALSGVTYEFFKVAYGSQGWIAGTYLNSGATTSCYVPTSSGCPRIVSRAEWGARQPTSTTRIAKPVPRVFIHHTAGDTCTTQAQCISVVKSIQNYHMNSKGWADIGYNFLVGQDGNVYEGRGWNNVGAHAADARVNHNYGSIGISVIGTFNTIAPNAAALNAVKQLIACGVSNGGLSGAYTLHGHRDGGCTECPGQAFYNIIRTWPRYGGKLAGSC